MKKRILVGLLISMVCAQYIDAKPIKIGVFTLLKIRTIAGVPIGGQYTIFGDNNKQAGTVASNENLTISMANGRIAVKRDSTVIGLYKRVKIKSNLGNVQIRMKPLDPAGYEQIFSGDIDFQLIDGEYIKTINYVDMEDYLPGVLEAEVGSSNQNEYLKTQAIISRTFAETHRGRHEADGYDLCDQVHCQAYKGTKRRQGFIMNAVENTEGVIITDSLMRPIVAAFHANSGGETANANDVWKENLSYLKATKDPFSLTSPKARWQQKILIADWRDYIVKKASLAKGAAKIDFTEPFDYIALGRMTDYSYQDISIPFKEIRNDWKFNSAYFSITTKGDYLIFNGLGNGHGVGLSQEGALQMAKQGKTCTDIIKFYYKGVRLSTIEEVDFLKD